MYTMTYIYFKLKIAKVLPIYKGKGQALDPNSYRPISILPAISKLFEALIEDPVRKFVERNGLLPQNQSGFRRKRSSPFRVL